MQELGCSRRRESHLVELLLSPAQPLSSAYGYMVLAHTGLDGSQGARRVLGSFWAAHGAPVTDGGRCAHAAHQCLPSPSRPHVPHGRE